MFISFVASKAPCSTESTVMSAREGRRVVVGTVVRRQSEEVVAEMAEIAKEDRARMAAQAAQALQKPPCPRRVEWSRLHPIRHVRPINPIPPPSPEEAAAAAVKRREFEAEEARILERARRSADRPRMPTPPRRSDDYYDLARWTFRRDL